MAGGINISLVANVREFIKGTKESTTALDEVIDSLDDVAREGSDMQRGLGRDLEQVADDVDRIGDAAETTQRTIDREMTDAARDADTAAGKMERSFREAFRDVQAESKDTSRKVSRDMDKAADEASDVTGEFKDEAASNFSEVASSFDGSMDSIVDLAQGTIGGLAGSLAGPLGIAAGAIAAAGGAFAAKWIAGTETSKQAVQDMYDDMLESGAEFLSRDFLQTQISNIVTGSEDAVASMGEVRSAAEILGATEEEVLLAFAGDMETRKKLTDEAKAKLEQYSGAVNGMSDAEAAAYLNAEKQARDTLGTLERLSGEYDEARGQLDQTSAALDRLDKKEGLRRAVESAQEYDAALGDASNRLTKMPKSIRTRVEVDTTEVDQFISDVERRRITLNVDAKLTSYGRSIA